MAWYDDDDDRNKPPEIDIDQYIEKIISEVKKMFGGKSPFIYTLMAAVVLLLWVASGFYTVRPDEVGVVKRFGAWNRITKPGPHLHLPFPIENVVKPKVTKVQRVEIGFRTISATPPARYERRPREALMLSGDENIVAVEFIVQYKIKDPIAYLFNVKNQPRILKEATEASMREVVGKNKIDSILTSKKFKIQQEAQHLLQSIMDSYKSGIDIVAVQLQDVQPPRAVMASFKDVASAREDKNKIINQADGYHNDIIPKAKGQAQKMINEAQAYAKSKISRAEGEARRFEKILEQYSKAKEITKSRLYIETMENILSKVDKIIVSNKMGENAVPYLPLTNNGLTGQGNLNRAGITTKKGN